MCNTQNIGEISNYKKKYMRVIESEGDLDGLNARDKATHNSLVSLINIKKEQLMFRFAETDW